MKLKTATALLFALACVLGAKAQAPLKLEWDPVAGWQSNVFLIYRADFVVMNTAQLPATPWTNVVGRTNLNLATATNEFYFYAVRATNINGLSDFSNVHSVPPVPRADSNLTARRSGP